MFDLNYVGDLALKFQAIESEYQQLRAERNFYLRQIACHAGFMGNTFSMDEKSAAIVVDFIKIFLKSNPAYIQKGEDIFATDITPRPLSTHFGGVRDDEN